MIRECMSGQDLAQLLGIDLKNRCVVGFTVRVRTDKIPTVVVHEYLHDLGTTNHKKYILVEVPA